MNGADEAGQIPEIELDDGGAKPAELPVINESGEEEDKLPPHAVLQDDGSVHLPLRHPVVLKYKSTGSGEVREEKFAELVFHRLTGADMNAISNTGEARRSSMAFARSARMAPAKMNLLFDRMDGADVRAGSEVLSFFLGNGGTTGR